MPSSGVRLARTSDVDDIAAVNVRSWQSHYSAVLPAEVLTSLDPRDLAMSWASSILNPPLATQRVLVAVDADRVVGYVAIGPSQDPDVDGSTAELLALEIDPDHLRRGHGSRLMAAAVDHLRASGMETVVAWCALDDQPRRAFLQSAGWGPDSAFRDVRVDAAEDGSDVVVREVRLISDLR
jgi:ribosomal protein S18 acetylase RimI-like enzyme